VASIAAFSNSNFPPSEKTENFLAALKKKNPPVAEEISARRRSKPLVEVEIKKEVERRAVVLLMTNHTRCGSPTSAHTSARPARKQFMTQRLA
jgi:hypothetical protein